MVKDLKCLWILTFFKHPVYPYGLKEDLIKSLKSIFSEKVILCSEYTTATQRLSEISLEYDAIFNECYATKKVICMV